MKNLSKSLALIGVVGALGLGTTAYAYQGDYSQKGPDFSEDRHEEMEQAFENNDYDSWKELMVNNDRAPRVVEVINEENFPKFVEAHEAGEAGDIEKADEIRSKLGLRTSTSGPLGNGHGRGEGKGHGQGNRGDNAGGNFANQNGDGSCDSL